MNDLTKDGSVDEGLTFRLPLGLTRFHRNTTAKGRASPECYCWRRFTQLVAVRSHLNQLLAFNGAFHGYEALQTHAPSNAATLLPQMSTPREVIITPQVKCTLLHKKKDQNNTLMSKKKRQAFTSWSIQYSTTWIYLLQNQIDHVPLCMSLYTCNTLCCMYVWV